MIEKKLLTKYRNINVYSVDGSKLRKAVTRQQVDEPGKHFDDFEDYGIHADFPAIPENEIWIGNELSEKEIQLVSRVALYRLQLLESGIDADAAYDKADALNRYFRAEQFGDASNVNVHVRPYKELDNGVIAWIVSGLNVRNRYDVNFIQGGNPQRYSYIPVNEIWLDNALDPDEYEAVLVHEATERSLMQQGMSYDVAHKQAEDAEYAYREKHK